MIRMTYCMRVPKASSSPLSEYVAKRAFDATPEPPAAIEARSGPLLFVIQQHAATRLHYDLRLECDGVLKSWAVPKGLSLNPADKRLAMQTEDHPYAYASFEGVIPPGQYGAGEMIVWDCGVYSPDEGGKLSFADRSEAQERVREGLAKGKLGFELRGEKVKGSFALVRTANKKSWLLIKHKDRFAGKADLSGQDRSVLSEMALRDLKSAPVHVLAAERLVPSGPQGALPIDLAPMQAESAEAVFDHPDWLWEPKLDGYRALAFISPQGVSLRSRKGLDLAGDFPGIAAELSHQGAAMVLDGEIVALGSDGKPSFNALQNARRA